MAKRFYKKSMMDGMSLDDAGRPSKTIVKEYPEIPFPSHDSLYDSLEGGIDAQIKADRMRKPAKSKY